MVRPENGSQLIYTKPFPSMFPSCVVNNVLFHLPFRCPTYRYRLLFNLFLPTWKALSMCWKRLLTSTVELCQFLRIFRSKELSESFILIHSLPEHFQRWSAPERTLLPCVSLNWCPWKLWNVQHLPRTPPPILLRPICWNIWKSLRFTPLLRQSHACYADDGKKNFSKQFKTNVCSSEKSSFRDMMISTACKAFLAFTLFQLSLPSYSVRSCEKEFRPCRDVERKNMFKWSGLQTQKEDDCSTSNTSSCRAFNSLVQYYQIDNRGVGINISHSFGATLHALL